MKEGTGAKGNKGNEENGKMEEMEGMKGVGRGADAAIGGRVEERKEKKRIFFEKGGCVLEKRC